MAKFIYIYLGPKDITVGDFWRMVWQEEANRIVMVANVKENGKVCM